MAQVESDLQVFLDKLASYTVPPIATLTPHAARMAPTLKNAVEEVAAEKLMARVSALASPMPEPVGRVHHIKIPSGDAEILARVFTPEGDGPHPVIVYFHGGGFVFADLNVYEPTCRALCNAAKAVVVSVGYRQAPEAPFPAAVEDAHAAVQWVANHADQLGVDAACLAVAGESAGGNLATVACLKARDEGGKMPVFQLLVYPVVDADMTRPSYTENAFQPPLLKEMMTWFFSHYKADETSPYALPLKNAQLHGLPPALVITAELDVLRDEGEAYVRALEAAGVTARGLRFTGVTHEFFGLAGVVSKAKDAMDQAAENLRDAFHAIREGEPVEVHNQ